MQIDEVAKPYPIPEPAICDDSISYRMEPWPEQIKREIVDLQKRVRHLESIVHKLLNVNEGDHK